MSNNVASTRDANIHGVRNLVFRMLGGKDGVTFGAMFPVRLQGSLTIDGGDGSNQSSPTTG
jgi:hypothetical protein